MCRVRRKKLCPPHRLKIVDIPSVLKRFLHYVEFNPFTGCWTWLGSQDENGYGRFKLEGKVVGAHRVSHAMIKGTIPEGYEIDHFKKTCHASCVNPFHLRKLKPLENARDGGYRRHEAVDRRSA